MRDSDGIIKSIAGFLNGNNIYEAHLLPFHRLASGKYNALGLKYDFGDCIPETGSSLEQCMRIFSSKNIKALLEE